MPAVPAPAAVAVLIAAALTAAALAGADGPAAAAAHAGPSGTISTVAGGVGGPARATKMALSPCGVSFSGGALYIGDHGAIRKVKPGTDWLTTPAGAGVSEPPGDGGPATMAGLFNACSAVTDGSGNLVIADSENGLVRVEAARTGTFYGQAMTAGHIYPVAGRGSGGLGDGGPATQANLGLADGVAVDRAGNLVIANTGNERVRVVAVRTGTFYGQAMTAGDIYTVAGGGSGGLEDGGPATSATLDETENLAVDGTGNLVLADNNNDRVRVVAVKTGTFYGQPMTAGDIYTVAGDGAQGFSGDGGPAASAELSAPRGVAVDAAGNILIAAYGNNRVRAVAASTGTFYGKSMTAGDIYTIAGNGHLPFSGDEGPATKASLETPSEVAVDGAGNVLISDDGHHRVRVVAASTGTFYGKAMTAGDIYTIAGGGQADLCCDGRPAAVAQLPGLATVTLDHAGNLLLPIDTRVRLAAASTGTFYGQAMTAGDLYTIAGDGLMGFSGDGGPAADAELGGVAGAGVDAASDLAIDDSRNVRVRFVPASTGTFYGQPMTAGDIYTIAGDGKQGFSGDGGPATSARLQIPRGVAIDGAGNLLIADWDNGRVRVVADHTGTFYGRAMTAGDIYTVAGGGTANPGDGGPATDAELALPAAVAVDGNGNLVIADQGGRIRVVAARTGTFYRQAMTAGDIYTVAGDGTEGFSGDGGPATSAELAFPGGVSVDGAGDLVITDTNNDRVRLVPASTGTFYGQPMTAGHIYTVAGDGDEEFYGDGGPATSAGLGDPAGAVVDGAGNLLIADIIGQRVRAVTP